MSKNKIDETRSTLDILNEVGYDFSKDVQSEHVQNALRGTRLEHYLKPKTEVEPEPSPPPQEIKTFNLKIEIVKPPFALNSANLMKHTFEKFVEDSTMNPLSRLCVYFCFNMNIGTRRSHRLKRSEIALATGLSDQMLRRYLKILDAQGYLSIVEFNRGKDGMVIVEFPEFPE